MSELTFSSAQPDETHLLADVLTSGTQYKLEHDDTIWGKGEWSEEEVRDMQSKSIAYLIRQDDDIVGTVSIQWEDERFWGVQPPTAGYIHRLAVKDRFHKLGIGERIINWAAGQVAAVGRTALRLDCDEKNFRLCKYYEGLGFIKVGRLSFPELDDGKYVEALYERKIYW
jgi:ribosomal protein S18 acetylase RimI-like enzyme